MQQGTHLSMVYGIYLRMAKGLQIRTIIRKGPLSYALLVYNPI